MRVSFKVGEEVEGYKVVSVNGDDEYTVENENHIISFKTDSGLGRSYSKINWYKDKNSNKTYSAMRFLYKFVNQVQLFSNALYVKYVEENKLNQAR